MTNKSIKSLIDKLNKNNLEGIYLRPLSELVDFAKVWDKKPNPTDGISDYEPYKFYFVKNKVGIYVAAVLDMWNDLHWFVINKERGNGHLTKAMKEIILFHLFQNREEQRVTVDENKMTMKDFKASEKVAISLGFVKSGINGYILTKEKYRTENYIDGENTLLTEERIKELKKEINYLSQKLWVIQTEVEMKFGNADYAEELKELVDEIKKHSSYRLEDVWWESKRYKNKKGLLRRESWGN